MDLAPVLESAQGACADGPQCLVACSQARAKPLYTGTEVVKRTLEMADESSGERGREMHDDPPTPGSISADALESTIQRIVREALSREGGGASSAGVSTVSGELPRGWYQRA